MVTAKLCDQREATFAWQVQVGHRQIDATRRRTSQCCLLEEIGIVVDAQNKRHEVVRSMERASVRGPLAQATRHTFVRGTIAARTAPVSDRVRVLYVEDVPALRELVVGALDPWRFQVLVAAGVDAAVLLASRQSFEAIICGESTTADSLRERVDDAQRIVVVDGPLETAETLRGTLLEDDR